MKLIHTADLHIGKALNGASLLEDQAHILDQIAAIVREEKADALIVAGDVYDKAAPAPEAVRLFDRFLSAVAGGGAAVLAVSGNHDCPERIEYGSGLLAEAGAYLCGVFQGAARRVALSDEYGPVFFRLLPFLRPAFVRPFFPEGRVESYDGAVAAALSAAPPVPGERTVLVAHQFVVAPGFEPERSESEIRQAGGVDSVSAALLEGYDYVALGHLHGPQRVRSPYVRYAGSPLKYSFSECRQEKSVTVVELREKGDVRVAARPLSPLRDMRRVRGPLAALVDPEIAAKGNREDYLHITLTDEEEIPGAMDRIRRVYPNALHLAFEREEAAPEELPDAGPEDAPTPLDLFAGFFEAQNGRALTQAQAETVTGLLLQAEEGV